MQGSFTHSFNHIYFIWKKKQEFLFEKLWIFSTYRNLLIVYIKLSLVFLLISQNVSAELGFRMCLVRKWNSQYKKKKKIK